MRLQVMNLDKTRNVMVGKQQRGCSKQENEGKKLKRWMAEDGQQVTRQGKRNQKSYSALGLRCTRVPGERVGLWGCTPGWFYWDPLHPIHRDTLPKHQTRVLLQQQMRPHITQLHYNKGEVNFSCYLISSTLWAGERGRVV